MNIGVPNARTYSNAGRARAAEATTRSILKATIELYWQTPIEDLTLAMIADRAGVTVQTLHRKFGTRDDLLAAAAEAEAVVVDSQLSTARAGDPAGSVRVLIEHYEEYGDGVIKLLSDESRLSTIAEIVAHGRKVHADWCELVFAEELAAAPRANRARRRAQLIALTDVYSWKVLRRDCGLTPTETEQAILEQIQALKGTTK